jgi:hypothetical protein
MDIVAPLLKTGVISQQVNLWLAVPIGFLFGFGIYQGGFTDSRIVGKVFYLKNIRVPIVMTSAIATGALGLWGLGLVGFLDLSQVYFIPTYLVPIAIGGFLFGIGMALGGFCPGTSIAAAAVGKIDAMIFLVGFLAGSLLFGDFYPVWCDIYESTYCGDWRIDELFGISIGMAVLLTVVVAIGMNLVMRLGQHYFWKSTDEECDTCPSPEARRYQLPVVIFGLGLAVVFAFYPSDAFIKGPVVPPYFIIQKSLTGPPEGPLGAPTPASPAAPARPGAPTAPREGC